jgi:ATP-grasp domain-containing protein
MDFLIQTIDGNIEHDFSFTLLESIKYNNWLNNDDDIKYELTDEETKSGFIPIGEVGFVVNYLREHHNKYPLPINVPEKLFRYAKRNIFNGNEEAFWGKGEMYVKSNSIIKYSINGLIDSNKYDLPVGDYQFSEIIDVQSEYRCFIFKNKLVGIQNYSGDFTIFPDVNVIKNMIIDYKDSPVAYTLDVGINESGTFVIEVHDFFSCGLYGFSDHRILPFMFSQWFYEFIKS